MKETFFDKWKHRFRGAWDVLCGRAWAGYGNPMDWEFKGPLDGSVGVIDRTRT